MKKIDLTRTTASLPDNTEIFFDVGSHLTKISSAEVKDGKLIFRAAGEEISPAKIMNKEKKKD